MYSDGYKLYVLTPDGCVDRGCEKERTLINDVCRWHCSMRWWRDRHDRDLDEGIRGQRDEDQPYQQTKNPIHGLNFGHDNGQGREPVRRRATKSVAFSVQAWMRQEAWQHKLHREWVQHGETGRDAVECCVTGGCQWNWREKFTKLWSDQLCCMVQWPGQQREDKTHD